ncbi:MAG: HWE histidine kinase domain-containing protein [Rhodoblastus sp.]
MAVDQSSKDRAPASSSVSIPLPALLFALIAASVIPLAVAGFAISIWFQQLARETQEAGLLYTSRSIAAAVDGELEKYTTLAQALARSPSLAADDLRAFEAEARRLFDDPNEGWLILASSDGRELVNTAYPGPADLPMRNEAGLRQQRLVAETGKPAVSTVFRSGPNDVWTVMIDVPVHSTPLRKYGIAVALPARNFIEFLSPPTRDTEWLAGVLDQNGRYVARVPGGEAMIGELASEGWRSNARKEGIAYFRSRENERAINANANSRLSDWTIGAGAFERQIEAAIRPITKWAIGAAVLAVALSMAFAFFIYRYLLRSLVNLQRAASAALNGSAPEFRSPVLEFDDLWRGLRDATAKKNEVERELAENDARFRMAAQAARFGVYQIAPSSGAASWTGDIGEIFGIDGPIGNMQTIMSAFHPDDRDATLRKIGHARRNVGPYEFEFRIVRTDGSVRWVLDRGESAGPLDSAGRVARMSGTFLDITQRKLVEERNRMLLREVSHRSKNLLTVIAIIARRTQSGSVSEFLKTFEARLRGLAANQDLLVASEWQGAWLKQLIVAHLEPFCENVQTRVISQGPDMLLGPEAAQNIGMALHELATNAAKYGALSNGEGRIAINWSIEGGRFRLEWAERDGPAVEPPSRKGFGSTVLTSLVGASLSGETSLSHDASGLRWTLTCPSSALGHTMRV